MGKKRSVNLSLDADLVARAKALDINLSQAIEPKLREIIADLEAERWADEHRDAIERFNERIRKFGPTGEEYRRYG